MDVVPLTDIGIVPNYQNQAGPELTSWNTWDEINQGPRQSKAIEEHYRRAALAKQEQEEPPPDYFQDMEPKIKRQMKVMVRRKDNNQMPSILSNAPDDVPMDSGELKSWEEMENREGDWAEGTEKWTMADALRQSRKEEKLKKNMEREMRRLVVS